MHAPTDTKILADKIITLALKHVPFDGWTLQALERGAADAGIDPDIALSLFHHDAKQAVAHYSKMIDQQLLEDAKKLPLAEMKIRERISALVMLRLKLLAPNKEAAHKAAIFLLLPTNARLGTKLIANTVDSIWRTAGDTATDFNYYTKRLLLSGVYLSTLTYWFNDTHEDWDPTQAFLNRRIDNVMVIPKLKSWLKGFFGS